MRHLVVLLVVVAVVALFPTSALALKSPPPGAPCQIAPKNEWTFCPLANLARRNLTGATLVFAGALLANLTRAKLDRADLSSVNFTGAKFARATFDGATFMTTVCPSGGVTDTGC